MALNISIATGSTNSKTLATVADMNAAREWLEDFASKCATPGEVVDFEVDGDCADAAVFTGANIKTFTVEPA